MKKLEIELGRIIEFYKENIKLFKIATVIIIVIVAVLIFAFSRRDEQIVISDNTDNSGIKTEESNITSNENKKFFVDISGEVNKPGVYEVSSNSRVFQIIEMAGGTTKKAALDAVNGAEIINDGQKIIIPSIEEYNDSSDKSEPNANSVSSCNKVNINTADATTLQTLTGVGPVTAQKIIDYRNEKGKFKSKEDIKNVSGIGDKTYAKMETELTI